MSHATATANVEPSEDRNEEVIQKAIREISHLATLPEVTLKIIKLVEDPDSTAQDLNKIITNDPALGARILKVVNSAFYGLPGQIGSTNRAIVLLGLNAVKNIAIAASLAKLFRGGQICPTFNARDLWHHSIAVGTGTRLLAAKASMGMPDEAFLAGLMHDIGIMVEIQARRPQFVEALERVRQDPSVKLRQAEENVIGATHEEFGTALCKLWKFPASFAYVTGYHHHPLDVAHKQRSLTCLVHIADVIAAKLELGFTASVECANVSTDILQHVNLTSQDLDQVAEELPSAMEEAMGLLQDK